MREQLRLKLKLKEKRKLKADIKSILEEKLRKQLNDACHKNKLLKNALLRKQVKRCLLTSTRSVFGCRMVAVSKIKSCVEAKKALCGFSPSSAVVLTDDNIKVLKETGLKGVFGKISLVTLKFELTCH